MISSAHGTSYKLQRFREYQLLKSGQINKKNDKWLCIDHMEVLLLMHTKFMSSMMVVGVNNKGFHVMPSSTLFQTWLSGHGCKRWVYMCQQDTTPSQKWMAKNLHKHVTLSFKSQTTTSRVSLRGRPNSFTKIY